MCFSEMVDGSQQTVDSGRWTADAARMQEYVAGARQRAAERRAALRERRERAWRVARCAAELLKTQFGAARVVVFGSLVRDGATFHERSDVDLAVWGIDERQYYRAVSQLLDIDPTISIDLVEVEYAKPSLRAAIDREGVEI